MKKLIFLMLITVFSIAAKAQTPTPKSPCLNGYINFPASILVDNYANCGVYVTVIFVNRGNCQVVPGAPSTTVLIAGGTGNSVSVPTNSYNPMTVALMARFRWATSVSGCDDDALEVQIDGLEAPTSWNCFSCGPYPSNDPSTDVPAFMPTCTECNAAGNIEVEWFGSSQFFKIQ